MKPRARRLKPEGRSLLVGDAAKSRDPSPRLLFPLTHASRLEGFLQECAGSVISCEALCGVNKKRYDLYHDGHAAQTGAAFAFETEDGNNDSAFSFPS